MINLHGAFETVRYASCTAPKKRLLAPDHIAIHATASKHNTTRVHGYKVAE